MYQLYYLNSVELLRLWSMLTYFSMPIYEFSCFYFSFCTINCIYYHFCINSESLCYNALNTTNYISYSQLIWWKRAQVCFHLPYFPAYNIFIIWNISNFISLSGQLKTYGKLTRSHYLYCWNIYNGLDAIILKPSISKFKHQFSIFLTTMPPIGIESWIL